MFKGVKFRGLHYLRIMMDIAKLGIVLSYVILITVS